MAVMGDLWKKERFPKGFKNIEYKQNVCLILRAILLYFLEDLIYDV